MGWILFFLFVVGGIVVCQYLKILEMEIRAEIGGEDENASDAETTRDLPKVDYPVKTVIPITQRIENAIKTSPGILQTGLYSELTDLEKKVLQKELLNLDRSGRISRVRSGSTYQLFLKK